MIALLMLAAGLAGAPAAQPGAAARAQAAPAPAPAQVWQVDQLRIARTTDPAAIRALQPDHTMRAVMARLKALGIPFTRQTVDGLPGGLPEFVRAQLAAVPPGEPFILHEPDFISINVVVGRRPATLAQSAPTAASPAPQPARPSGSPGAPPPPTGPEEVAAEHLMTVMHADDQFREFVPKVINTLIPTLLRGNNGREADVRRIVSEEFGTVMIQSAPMIHAANRRMLAEHFTVQDLNEIAGFYASALGQKVVHEMPAIQLQMLQVGQQIGQAAMQTALPRILERMKSANMAVPQGV